MLSPRGRGRPHTIRDTLRGSTVSWFPCAGVLSRTSPHGRCRPQARATRPPAGLPKCGRESSLSDCSPKGGSCSRFPGIALARCGASRSVWPTPEVTGIWCLCSASVPGPGMFARQTAELCFIAVSDAMQHSPKCLLSTGDRSSGAMSRRFPVAGSTSQRPWGPGCGVPGDRRPMSRFPGHTGP
jgi:hypothetical protein